MFLIALITSLLCGGPLCLSTVNPTDSKFLRTKTLEQYVVKTPFGAKIV